MIKSHTTQALGNVSLVGSAGGSLATWLAENASLVTVLFTGAGFIATCIFYSFSIYLKMKESRIKLEILKGSSNGCENCDAD